jgi:hypothetical protein
MISHQNLVCSCSLTRPGVLVKLCLYTSTIARVLAKEDSPHYERCYASINVSGMPATLKQFVLESPLASSLPAEIDEEQWAAAAAELAENLRIDPGFTKHAQKQRVFHWYLPTLYWLLSLHASNRGHALVVGLTAPQVTMLLL